MANHTLDENYNNKTSLRKFWPIVKENFAKLLSWFNAHVNGTADRHRAEHIDYDSSATVKQKIAQEITDRQNGDNALQSKLNTEITNRANGDSALQNKITAEITNRQNADKSLQDKIGDLSNLDTTEKTNLVDAINAVLGIRIDDGAFVPCYDYGNDVEISSLGYDEFGRFGFHFFQAKGTECAGLPEELTLYDMYFNFVLLTIPDHNNAFSTGGTFFDQRKEILFMFDADLHRTWERYYYQISDEDMEYTEWVEVGTKPSNTAIEAEISAPFSESVNLPFHCYPSDGNWEGDINIPQIFVKCGAFGDVNLPSATLELAGTYGEGGYCYARFVRDGENWSVRELYRANRGDTDGYIEVSGNELKSVNIYVGYVETSASPSVGGIDYSASLTLNTETMLTLNQITSADGINTEISEKIATLESRVAALEAPSGSGIVYAEKN